MNGLLVRVYFITAFSSYYREMRESLTEALMGALLQSRGSGAASGREGEESQRGRGVQGREREKEGMEGAVFLTVILLYI